MYWFGVTGLLLVLTTLPGTVPLMLLDRSAGNIPLVAVCLIPLAPAVSAALYALRDRDRGEGLTALHSFLRGYRRNAIDVLALWLPALAVATMLGISLANLEHAGVPGGYGLVLVVLAVMITVWAGNAVVIVSFFSLRTRDIARLGVYYMARTPLASLGVLATVLVAAGIVYLTFDAVLGLVGSILVWMLLRTCEPMLRHVHENFIAAGD